MMPTFAASQPTAPVDSPIAAPEKPQRFTTSTAAASFIPRTDLNLSRADPDAPMVRASPCTRVFQTATASSPTRARPTSQTVPLVNASMNCFWVKWGGGSLPTGPLN